MGALDDDIESVLYSSEEISRRVSELAAQITADLDNNKSNNTESSPPVVVVGVATGAFLFLADLVRNVKLPITVDFIRAESYGSGTVSSGDPRILSDLKMDILGKHVILSGNIICTLKKLLCNSAHLSHSGASSISVCTFLDKPARRKVNFELVGEGKYYCGFECPDYFVVGYGLDLAELYRNLPYVGVLKPEMYK
ncbi:hypothetical protein RHMOL_Rhmol06G0128600 [Rhododendron molle]|uniref:Uncharacterized protein n=1 Tax=Rhododendron molle TaxID=49168 RepID=A0ACC0NBW7_RHOML|nr:hypothetical protein RHMOL_Rhmol06G0128600 [Rhododendron molle]